MANQNIGGSTFGQKVEEKLNPSQNWQHQIHAAALAQKSDPMTMLGFVVGNKLLNPIMKDWLSNMFNPKEKSTGTTVTDAWEKAKENANAENYDLTDYANSLLKPQPRNFGKDVSLLG